MQHKASPAARGGADLGNDSIGGLLFKLALPAIVAQLINVLYNMVDRMYIGHLPEIGETALTGVGVCFPLITAISAFAALVSMGGAPRASIFLGRGDKETAERILWRNALAFFQKNGAPLLRSAPPRAILGQRGDCHAGCAGQAGVSVRLPGGQPH